MKKGEKLPSCKNSLALYDSYKGEYKQCKPEEGCGMILPKTEDFCFMRKRPRADGALYMEVSPRCRDCTRERNRKSSKYEPVGGQPEEKQKHKAKLRHTGWARDSVEFKFFCGLRP